MTVLIHTVLCRHRRQDWGRGLGIKSGEKEEGKEEEGLVNNKSVPNSFLEEECGLESLQGFGGE